MKKGIFLTGLLIAPALSGYVQTIAQWCGTERNGNALLSFDIRKKEGDR